MFPQGTPLGTREHSHGIMGVHKGAGRGTFGGFIRRQRITVVGSTAMMHTGATILSCIECCRYAVMNVSDTQGPLFAEIRLLSGGSFLSQYLNGNRASQDFVHSGNCGRGPYLCKLVYLNLILTLPIRLSRSTKLAFSMLLSPVLPASFLQAFPMLLQSLAMGIRKVLPTFLHGSQRVQQGGEDAINFLVTQILDGFICPVSSVGAHCG